MFNTRQYTTEITGAFLLYTAAILTTGWVTRHAEMEGAALYLVALIPALPTALVFVVILRALRRMDELQQRIIGEATIIAASLVGFASFAYGLLESYADMPSVPLVWILPALFAVQGVALPFIRRRYQ